MYQQTLEAEKTLHSHQKEIYPYCIVLACNLLREGTKKRKSSKNLYLIEKVIFGKCFDALSISEPIFYMVRLAYIFYTTVQQKYVFVKQEVFAYSKNMGPSQDSESKQMAGNKG